MTEADLLAKVTQARKRLLLDYPWFGTLALMLKVEISDKPKYAAHTDGTFIRFRPDYVEKASATDLVLLWAHESEHCALLHPYRRGNRDLQEANISADYVVNGLLKASGLELPKNWLYDPQYDGMSFEQVYAKRQGGKQKDQGQPQSQPQPQGQQGQQQGPSGAGKPQPGQQPQPGAPQPGPGDEIPDSSGEFGDAPAVESGQPGKGAPASGAPDGPKMTAEDWKIAGEQAARICQKAGNDPGDAARAAKAAHEPDTDWRGELQEFIEHQTPSDYSWSSPNRRHIAGGLYLPGIHKENLGIIDVGLDCSGSISPRLFSLFASHLKTILLEAKPEKIRVIYWDTKVQAVEEFTPDDFDIELRTTGGGGTRPQCLFNYIAEQEEQPIALVNFTDLDFYSKPTEPEGYPTLWVTGVDVRKTEPFGKLIRIDAWSD
jgi:predicted metal-dependent peptidase